MTEYNNERVARILNNAGWTCSNGAGGSMSTSEPMPQERLDAIQARLSDVGAPWEFAPTPDGDGGEVIRVGEQGGPIAWGIDIDAAGLIAHAPEDLADLLAEVERLQQFESIVSWQWGDTTDGRTREDMVERALRQSYGPKTWQEMCDSGDDCDVALVATSRDDMRDTLNAALAPQGEA